MKELTTEQKAKAYDEALKRARQFSEHPLQEDSSNIVEYIFPELKESEDERIRQKFIKLVKMSNEVGGYALHKWEADEMLAWLEKQGEPQDKGEISDGYHTFNELYYYRMLYNAAFFNMLPKEWVHKSKKHHDGEDCFGGGWFIVMANLPTGQISNHYELKDWDLFQIPEKDIADEWDGHTPQEAAERLHKFLLEKQGEQKPFDYEHANIQQKDFAPKSAMEAIKEEKVDNANKVGLKFKVGDWIINRTDATIMRVINNTDFYESVEIGGQRRTDTYNYVEWDFRLWTIQDAKDGDVLIDTSTNGKKCPFIFKETKPSNIKTDVPNPLTVLGYCGIGGAGFTKGDGWGDTANCIYYPATKEQRDLLFQKMNEAGYEWDAEKKELKKIEQKPAEEYSFNIKSELFHQLTKEQQELWKKEIEQAYNAGVEASDEWSEEDETKMRAALAFIKSEFPKKGNEEFMEDTIEWLKSLRPQNNWKPSDEQMKQLGWIAEQNKDNMIGKELISLYQDLRKLREEDV